MDIVIDFDGTVVTHEYPFMGKDIGAAPVLRRLIENGHRLILFTMRSDLNSGKSNFLTQAVNWFIDNKIPLHGIQHNPDQDSWTYSPKAYGQLIIDDSALGAPTKFDYSYSSSPFIDWERVEIMLEYDKILNKLKTKE